MENQDNLNMELQDEVIANIKKEREKEEDEMTSWQKKIDEELEELADKYNRLKDDIYSIKHTE